MSELLNYLIFYALFAATIGFLFAMLFIGELRRWWMRTATVGAGLTALLMPLFVTAKILGYPDPWPPEGRYEVLGWEIVEADHAFFVLVKKPGNDVPHHYKLPFRLDTALKLQEAEQLGSIFRNISLVVTQGLSDEMPGAVFTFEKVFPDE